MSLSLCLWCDFWDVGFSGTPHFSISMVLHTPAPWLLVREPCICSWRLTLSWPGSFALLTYWVWHLAGQIHVLTPESNEETTATRKDLGQWVSGGEERHREIWMSLSLYHLPSDSISLSTLRLACRVLWAGCKMNSSLKPEASPLSPDLCLPGM